MGNKVLQLQSTVLRITPALLAQIEQAAVCGYPEEACGLLLGARAQHVGQVISVPNNAPSDRHRRYEIDPRLILHWDFAASESGLTITGFFHSHPDHEPVPSATDTELALPGYVYLIAGVSRGTSGGPMMTGLAAWTFDEASTSFRELKIDVEVAPDEIEYYI